MAIGKETINDTTDYLCKRFPTNIIQEYIDEESRLTNENGKLVGFGISQTLSNNQHEIEMKPTFLRVKDITEQSQGSNLKIELGSDSFAGERKRISSGNLEVAGVNDKIQFFQELIEDTEYTFDFAFISLIGMELLIKYSNFIVISGAKIDIGEPTLEQDDPVQEGPFFTFKVESEFDVNAVHFPQLLIGCPCPPYWKHASE